MRFRDRMWCGILGVVVLAAATMGTKYWWVYYTKPMGDISAFQKNLSGTVGGLSLLFYIIGIIFLYVGITSKERWSDTVF